MSSPQTSQLPSLTRSKRNSKAKAPKPSKTAQLIAEASNPNTLPSRLNTIAKSRLPNREPVIHALTRNPQVGLDTLHFLFSRNNLKYDALKENAALPMWELENPNFIHKFLSDDSACGYAMREALVSDPKPLVNHAKILLEIMWRTDRHIAHPFLKHLLYWVENDVMVPEVADFLLRAQLTLTMAADVLQDLLNAVAYRLKDPTLATHLLWRYFEYPNFQDNRHYKDCYHLFLFQWKRSFAYHQALLREESAVPKEEREFFYRIHQGVANEEDCLKAIEKGTYGAFLVASRKQLPLEIINLILHGEIMSLGSQVQRHLQIYMMRYTELPQEVFAVEYYAAIQSANAWLDHQHLQYAVYESSVYEKRKQEMLGQPSVRKLCALLENPGSPVKLLQDILLTRQWGVFALSNSSLVRAAELALQNPDIGRFYHHPPLHHLLHTSTILGPSLHRWILGQVCNDENALNFYIRQRYDIPEQILVAAAFDYRPSVRASAIAHKKLPEYVIPVLRGLGSDTKYHHFEGGRQVDPELIQKWGKVGFYPMFLALHSQSQEERVKVLTDESVNPRLRSVAYHLWCLEENAQGRTISEEQRVGCFHPGCPKKRDQENWLWCREHMGTLPYSQEPPYIYPEAPITPSYL